MSAESVILQGRTFTEALMQTACVILRADGTFTEDPATHVETPNYDTIYTGVCKLKFSKEQRSTAEIPGIIAADQNATLSLPIGAPGAGDVTTGDVWVCTANPMDASLIGRRLQVTGIHRQTFATAHRFPVTEVS